VRIAWLGGGAPSAARNVVDRRGAPATTEAEAAERYRRLGPHTLRGTAAGVTHACPPEPGSESAAAARVRGRKCGTWFLWTTLVLVPVTLAIPYLPHADLFGFVKMPSAVPALIVVISMAYVAATELVKIPFFRSTAPRGVTRAAVPSPVGDGSY
jgi:hypothetical protein